MFQLDDTKSSTTQQQLEALHAAQRVTDPELDKHIKFLHSLGLSTNRFSKTTPNLISLPTTRNQWY